MEYKARTRRPDALSRGVLLATAMMLETPQLRLQVERLLREPIERPALHSGSEHDDYFAVTLSAEATSHIVDELLSAEAAAVTPEGFTTPAAASAADLVDSWGNYLKYVEGIGA